MWSASAAGATPYFDAIQRDLYSNANGRVRFKDDKTGTIHLVCNVTTVVGDPDHLRLTYRNAFANSSARVAATLKRVNKNTGNIVNIVSIGSESFPSTEEDEIVNAVSVAIPPDEEPFDFHNNFYYVVITLRRDTTEHNPTVLGVALIGGVS